MLEKTHARIAKHIANAFNLTKEEGDLLESGSIRPDSYIAFPHHKGKDAEIFTDILDARALFLSNDDEAFVKLGEALHFIADKWTLKPRIDIKHFQYETNIESCPFLDDSQFLDEIKRSVIPTKSKVYYQNLVSAMGELLSTNDFSADSLISKMANDYFEDLESKQEDFLNDTTRFSVYALKSLLCGEDAEYEVESVSAKDLVPFPIISYVAWITRESTDAENYSTPTIDLNISLRLCKVVCRFVFSKNDLKFMQKHLDWNKLSLDWSEDLKEAVQRTFGEYDSSYTEVADNAGNAPGTDNYYPLSDNEITAKQSGENSAQQQSKSSKTRWRLQTSVDPDYGNPHPWLWTVTFFTNLFGIWLFLANIVLPPFEGIYGLMTTNSIAIGISGLILYSLIAFTTNLLLKQKGIRAFYRTIVLNSIAITLFVIGWLFPPF